MARMYPAEAGPETQSNAERLIFKKICDETPEDWVALHSLGLKGHSRKLWAEADFVLITPEGVWVLEVKGGAIARHGRVWYQNGHEMRQSPFDQAGGAAGALRRDLRDHVAAAGRRGCVAHGVILPDVVFDVDGTDIERKIVYDADDRARPFEDYVDRLAKYWHGRLGRRPGRLERTDRSAIVHRLAGDFDLVRSLRAVLDEAGVGLVRLTEQQKTAIDGLRTNPRVVVEGGAGTGKTVLAVHEATVAADAGAEVLLCCHSRRLAGELRASLQDRPTIKVEHYFGLLVRLIAEAGLRDQLPDASEPDLFDVFYPAVAVNAIGEISPGAPMFDVLVVDEAQDVMLATHLEVFDRLLAGGLEQGTWRFFSDPNQDVFAGTGVDARHRLRECSAGFKLTVNCRNTLPIAMQAALLGGQATQPTLASEGPEAEVVFVDDDHHRRRTIGKILRDWIAADLSPSEITVVSPRGREGSSLASGLPDGVSAVLWEASADGAATPRPDNAIEFATIAGFKGLEAPAVLVVDLDRLDQQWERINGYLAASRATSVLALVLPSSLEDDYLELARELGRRDREGGD